jgi:hypothetical protein
MQRGFRGEVTFEPRRKCSPQRHGDHRDFTENMSKSEPIYRFTNFALGITFQPMTTRTALPHPQKFPLAFRRGGKGVRSKCRFANRFIGFPFWYRHHFSTDDDTNRATTSPKIPPRLQERGQGVRLNPKLQVRALPLR